MEIDGVPLRDHLAAIERSGWDCAVGRSVLVEVRREIVRPAVRRAGLRGPAAAQAESTAWAAAWDALRRPTALAAGNPAGMVWVAVRRALRAETAWSGPRDGPPPSPAPAPDAAAQATGAAQSRGVQPLLSLEAARERGWEPASAPDSGRAAGLGPSLDLIATALVEQGWSREELEAAVTMLADECSFRDGRAASRWRAVADQARLPHWRVRRLAALLLGESGGPGLVRLVREGGPAVLDEPAVLEAMRSTTLRWARGPGSPLADRARLASCRPARAGVDDAHGPDVAGGPIAPFRGPLRRNGRD